MMMNGLMLLASTIHKNSSRSVESKRKFQETEIDGDGRQMLTSRNNVNKLAKLTASYWRDLKDDEKAALTDSSSLWICNPHRTEMSLQQLDDYEVKIPDSFPVSKIQTPKVNIEKNSKSLLSKLKKKKSKTESKMLLNT